MGETRGMPEDSIPAGLRDRAVAALTRGFAADQLSDGELETLLDRVYGATTLTELNTLINSLPVLRSATNAPSDTLDVVQSGRFVPGTEAQQITALFSGQEARLTGVVPRRMRLRARLGYVELDLRQATFEPGVTEIDVGSLMGYVQIHIPGDVRVESHGRALFGFFSLKGAGSHEVSSDTVVRISGRAILGFAECHVGASGPEAQSG